MRNEWTLRQVHTYVPKAGVGSWWRMHALSKQVRYSSGPIGTSGISIGPHMTIQAGIICMHVTVDGPLEWLTQLATRTWALCTHILFTETAAGQQGSFESESGKYVPLQPCQLAIYSYSLASSE